MTVTEYEQVLTRLCGRARRRTLDAGDLRQVLLEAQRTGMGSRCGGHVANSYGYPASTMRMAAFRLPDGDYAVKTDWGNATKSSASVPIYGGDRALRKFVEDVRSGKCGIEGKDHGLEGASWTRLARRDVHRVLAQARRAAREDRGRQWPESEAPETVVVTREDSLAAGNCASETERVAAWFHGRTAVSAAELRAVILRREPTLVAFARRAVAQALATARAVA